MVENGEKAEQLRKIIEEQSGASLDDPNVQLVGVYCNTAPGIKFDTDITSRPHEMSYYPPIAGLANSFESDLLAHIIYSFYRDDLNVEVLCGYELASLKPEERKEIVKRLEAMLAEHRALCKGKDMDNPGTQFPGDEI